MLIQYPIKINAPELYHSALTNREEKSAEEGNDVEDANATYH
jgi:hypothetical protein